ncbi:hypothetical protein AG0111_0g2685 [Alternaria gaisen]|uniref:Uncharacterized protein n=1 Tax=Alternaria gaisen TaxID=167740 RepID=A0ACB6FX98_9PLEO|nr:hypothetical protein AG0111_0g2685 [Alternaria gaisen]
MRSSIVALFTFAVAAVAIPDSSKEKRGDISPRHHPRDLLDIIERRQACYQYGCIKDSDCVDNGCAYCGHPVHPGPALGLCVRYAPAAGESV